MNISLYFHFINISVGRKVLAGIGVVVLPNRYDQVTLKKRVYFFFKSRQLMHDTSDVTSVHVRVYRICQLRSSSKEMCQLRSSSTYSDFLPEYNNWGLFYFITLILITRQSFFS